MRQFRMTHFSEILPALPGMSAPSPRAIWPVWKNSAREKIRPPKPPTKKEAYGWLRQLRDLEWQTRQPGGQGRVTKAGLALARALIEDFLNWTTGQLDPSYESLAKKACLSRSGVWRGLIALKNVGFLSWWRRCKPVEAEGEFLLEQDTNLYRLRPPSEWIGYKAPAEAPAPEPGTWGDHPCGTRDALTEALQETTTIGRVQQLQNDPTNRLAAVLAKLGQSILAESSSNLREFQNEQETCSKDLLNAESRHECRDKQRSAPPTA